MSLASFVINSKTEDDILIKPCFVSIKVIKQLLDVCDDRIVFENTISSKFMDWITLDLDENVAHCQHIMMNWKDALNEVGFIDFCSFFHDRYDWNDIEKKRNLIDKNRIIMYVKFNDAIENTELQNIFDAEHDYANALGHFSERGIFLSKSELTLRGHRMLTYLENKYNVQLCSQKSIFEEFILSISNDVKRYFNDTNLDIMYDISGLIKYFYRPDADWKNKLFFNSSIAYMVSPVRYVLNGDFVRGNWDILVKLLSTSLSATRDSYLYDSRYDVLTLYRQMESLDSKVHESITEEYGTIALFDIMSRQASQSTDKIIDWIYSSEIENNSLSHYYRSEGFGLLYLTRMIDTNMGVNPNYKRYDHLHCSIDHIQARAVDDIEETIKNHTLPSIRKIRFRNKMKLDSDPIPEEDI